MNADTNTDTDTDFPAKFLQQVLDAMEHVDEIEKASTWNESKWDTPPLCKVTSGPADEAVDPEIFKKFETILHFLLLGIFGTDVEGRGRGRWVRYYLKDTTRDGTVLPFFRVPRAGWDSSLRELVKARERAQWHAEATQDYVKDLDRSIGEAHKELFAHEDFQKRAKGCKACDGKGYIKYKRKEYSRRSREAHRDDDNLFNKRSGERVKRIYHLGYLSALCDDCQPDDKVDYF